MLATVAATLAVASCSTEPAATPTPAPRTYLVPPETARPDETVVKATPVVDGQMRFRVLGFSDGMPSIFGSHAEWNAKGLYTRVRVLIESTDRTNQKFDAKQQLLVAADGRTFHVDTQAQAIKRQPDELPWAPSSRCSSTSGSTTRRTPRSPRSASSATHPSAPSARPKASRSPCADPGAPACGPLEAGA